MIKKIIAATLVSFVIAPTAFAAEQTPLPTPSVKDEKECTYKHYRFIVRKAYSKKKVSKSDHQKIFVARACLKNQKKAINYQRKQGVIRKQRLDPWGYAWSKVDSGLKSTLARVKHCESTGSYTIVNSSGHGGAYQYDRATWAEAGGSGAAQDAPPREQDVRTARFFPGHESRWDASRHCWG